VVRKFDPKDADRIKLLSQNRVWDKFIKLNVLELEQKNRDGRVQHLNREVHHHGHGASILLYDKSAGSVVLVRQFRPGAYLNDEPPFLLEAPAGLLDDDTPDVAICREAMEETGYHVSSARFLFDMYGSPGTLTEKVSLFYAEVDISVRAGEGGGLKSEGEDIEVVILPLKTAYEMIASGEIVDGKTIILLQWAMLNRESL
jgi:nudix-type nucleoside diphosphatase (YffH/AdpP family)